MADPQWLTADAMLSLLHYWGVNWQSWQRKFIGPATLRCDLWRYSRSPDAQQLLVSVWCLMGSLSELSGDDWIAAFYRDVMYSLRSYTKWDVLCLPYSSNWWWCHSKCGVVFACVVFLCSVVVWQLRHVLFVSGLGGLDRLYVIWASL